MSEIYNHLYEDLEDKLRMIDLEEDNILKKSEQSFQTACCKLPVSSTT